MFRFMNKEVVVNFVSQYTPLCGWHTLTALVDGGVILDGVHFVPYTNIVAITLGEA